jgi:CIC family chloride channel protein
MYAPLTGIFLIAEITGGYELIIPLMLVSTVSFTIAKFFEPYSMDVKDLMIEKKIFTENYDQNILGLIKIHEIVDTHYETIYENDNLTNLLTLWQNSNKDVVVCKDENGKYLGYILFDQVKQYVINLHLHQKVIAKELLSKSKVKVNATEQITTIIDKFDKFNLWYLPVFEDDHFVGFISKKELLMAYRDKLKLTLS